MKRSTWNTLLSRDKYLPIKVKDLDKYAALVEAQKLISSMVTKLKDFINDDILNQFVETQDKTSIKGIDNKSNATFQLRKRSITSHLSDKDILILDKAKIDVIESKSNGMFINSKYFGDEDLLDKVFERLEDIVPEDFFEASPVSYSVGEFAVGQALIIPNKQVRRGVLKIVTTQVIAPNFGGSKEDMLEILDSHFKTN